MTPWPRLESPVVVVEMLEMVVILRAPLLVARSETGTETDVDRLGWGVGGRVLVERWMMLGWLDLVGRRWLIFLFVWVLGAFLGSVGMVAQRGGIRRGWNGGALMVQGEGQRELAGSG